MFGEQFYPTPPELADKLVQKFTFNRTNYVLEPSIGKGDLREALLRNTTMEINHRSYQKHKFYIDFCEIDPNLRKICEDMGQCVGENFLEYKTFTRYDIIVMNPPFKDGDRHLLHAISLLKSGGQLGCILNAETIRNACTEPRRELLRKLQELNAEVEFIADAFKNAERKTDVEIALIYLKMPEENTENLLKGLAQAAGMEVENGKVYDMVSSDPIVALVQRFNFEAVSGLNMIKNFRQISKYMSDPEGEAIYPHIKTLNNPILTIGINSNETDEVSLENKYMRALRGKYWATLFAMPELLALMTEEVREKYNAELNKFKFVDFTLPNIKRLQLNLSKTSSESIEVAVEKQFDKLTYGNSMEKDGNVHYYSGWKTNSAYKLRSKIIIPVYELFSSVWGTLDVWHLRDKLLDIEKIMNFLDGGNTEGKDLQTVLDERFKSNYGGERKPPYANRELLHFKYFDVMCFKKGTIHLWFKDEKLLKRWNLFIGKKKNWLPTDYGRKDYSKMTVEEQEVVESFEGKEQYEETVQNAGYYLNGVTVWLLNA